MTTTTPPTPRHWTATTHRAETVAEGDGWRLMRCTVCRAQPWQLWARTGQGEGLHLIVCAETDDQPRAALAARGRGRGAR